MPPCNTWTMCWAQGGPVCRELQCLGSSQADPDIEQYAAAEIAAQKIRRVGMGEQYPREGRTDQRQRTPALAQELGGRREVAVEVGYDAFQADERQQIQFAGVEAAFAVVVRFLAQGRGQARLQLGGADAPRFGLAAHQLAEREGPTPTFQLDAPLIVEAPALVQHEKHLETGLAKQHVRRFLPGRAELLEPMADVQGLQQALAHPTLTLPLAGIGKERVSLLRLVREQAQII